MIAQARISSPTRATVHLAAQTVELRGADMDEVRTRVKDVFIGAARREGGPLDVVIVEPGALHHLTVEPSGRIAGRPADTRPVFGPALETPDAGGDGEHAGTGGRRRAAHAASTAASADSANAAPTSGFAPPTDTVGTGAPGATGGDDEASEDTVVRSVPRGPARPATSGTHSAAPAPSSSSAPSASPAPSAIPPAPPAASAASEVPSAASAAEAKRPTLQDLQNSATPQRDAPPQYGWQGWVARATAGRLAPRPNRAERRERDQLARIRRQLDGPKSIAVVNLKGGAHKTTASLMIAATLGVARGGSVLAWDNNETRGTLGWRGIPAKHHRTALDLLHDVERLRGPHATVADLDAYVRPQGDMRFDILASDEDAGSAASIDGEAFELLDDTLARFYRLKVIDTGNNVRASNWLAAVRNADQLVIISTVREDTFNAAAWMIDELRATGLAEQVDSAVTVLSQSAKGNLEPALRKRLVTHFGAHTRAVVEVPFEPQFVDGGHLDWPRVSDPTKKAWLEATALIVDGL